MCDNNTGESSEGRQRLRPWLEAQINGGQVPGLYWLDEEKTKFRIPWKHRGKQDWDPSHGKIFMEWAKQTGRYREDVDQEDYVQWKTRLRCALHKAKDFKYLKEESQDQEDFPEPFRVYSLAPRTAAKRKVSPTGATAFNLQAPLVDCAYWQPGLGAEAPLPTMLEAINVSEETLPSDLRDIKSMELLRALDGVESMNISQSFSDIKFDILPETKPSVTAPSSGGDFSLSMLANENPLFACDQLVESMSSMTLDPNVMGDSVFSSANAATGNLPVTAIGTTAAGPFTQGPGYVTAGQTAFAGAGCGVALPASGTNWPQTSTASGVASNLSPVDWGTIGKTDPDISQFLLDFIADHETSSCGAAQPQIDWLVPRNTETGCHDDSSDTYRFYGACDNGNGGEIAAYLLPGGGIPVDQQGTGLAAAVEPSTLEGVVCSIGDDGEMPTGFPSVEDTATEQFESPNFDDLFKCNSFN